MNSFHFSALCVLSDLCGEIQALMPFDLPQQFMFSTPVETGSLHFTKKEAEEKQHKTIVTRAPVGILPPGAIGKVSGMTRLGSEFLLTVRWQFAESCLTITLSKHEYGNHFELPLVLENTTEAMYLALDFQKKFNDNELKTFSARLKELAAPPHELGEILSLHPEVGNRIEVLSLACDLAVVLDRNTERLWTERMTDTLTKKLTFPEIAELYLEFNHQDDRLGLGAESRIVRNACDEILRSCRTS
jgi:hypothetical protein